MRALDHTATLEVADPERADLLVRLGRAQHQVNDPAALTTLTEATELARRCDATKLAVQAALTTDRGFLHLGPVAPAQVAIIEPHAGEVATNLGPVAAYAGRLASLLGRHDLAEQHLGAAVELVDAFGWDYHRATTRISLAAARRCRFGALDDRALAPLEEAERIASARGLSGLVASIDVIRG